MKHNIFRNILCTLLCLTLLPGLISLAGFAAGNAGTAPLAAGDGSITPASSSTHSHPICGSRCVCSSDSHSSYTWKAWDGTTRMYNGNYYLTEDIVLDSTMILDYSYTSYLCLNGHSITCEDTVFYIYSYRSLLITDCKGTGKIETTGADGTIRNNRYLSIWGGTILNSYENGISSAVHGYNGTSTFLCGGTIQSEEGPAIYAYPGSKIQIQGGTVHSNGTSAITGHSDTSDTLGSLTVSGGRITANSGYNDVLDIQNGSFTLSGGYIDGDVSVYDERGTTSISGGTINGYLLTTSGKTTVTGGDLSADFWGNAEVNAGIFRGSCSFSGLSNTVSGGDFTNCSYVSIYGNTWIYGGFFDEISVSDKPLYLSGIPEIDTLEVLYPSVVSAQNPDGTGSYGGDPIEIILNYNHTSWKDGDIVIKNVRSDAAATKFVLGGENTRWNALERSGSNLVLRVMPHGIWGSNVTWGIVDGVLTISGTGAIQYTHSGREYPWGDYADEITAIVVEPGITSIPAYTFEYCENAATITLPETVTSLNLNAFQDCGSLNNLLLPSSITSISGTSNSLRPSFIRCESLTDLYYLGTAEEWAAIPEASRVMSSDSTMTTHFLTFHDATATCIAAGTAAYYRFDDTSVYSSYYNMDKEPIPQPEAIPALGHRVVVDREILMDPLTVENTDPIPFILSNGTYFSNNHGNSSSSQLKITAQYDCVLTLHYGVSSESNFDKLFILLNGTQKAVISGNVTGQTLTLTLTAGDVITVRYTKDGSQSSGDDRGWVTLNYEFVPGMSKADVQADTLEPDCINAVTCDYCRAVVKEALGHRIIVEQEVQVDPLTVENTSQVPFVLTDGTYYSSNHTAGSSSQLRIIARYACTLTLHYGVSSESGYDKLYILHNSTAKDTISGAVSGKTLMLTLTAGDVITVQYAKDGSVDKNQDRGWVSLEYDLILGTENKDIPADTLEPDCTTAIICDYCQTVVKEAAGHTYSSPEFIWTGLTSVSASATCHCGHKEEVSCTLNWDRSVPGKLTLTASAILGTQEFTDSRVITAAVDGGLLTVTLPEEFPGGWIYAAAYLENGQMSACDFLHTAGTSVTLPFTGEHIRLFFLTDTLCPITPVLLIS